jgi:cell division protein FtsB
LHAKENLHRLKHVADQTLYVDFGIWGTIRKVAIGVTVFALMCGLAAWYVPIVRQSAALQKEIEIRREALKKQYERQQQLQEEAQALRSNPDAVEEAAREKLGLVKPNETIYRFESDKTRK